MNKQEIIRELHKLDKLGVKRDEYIIVYGAAMVLHGIRFSASDIDIDGTKKAFTTLTDQGYKIEEYKGIKGKEYIKVTNLIDMFRQGTQQTKTEYVMVSGFRVQSPESILCEKEARGREKDKADVEKLKTWISNHNDK